MTKRPANDIYNYNELERAIKEVDIKVDAKIDAQDDKRHAQNNINQATISNLADLVRSTELKVVNNVSDIGLLAGRVSVCEKNQDRVEKVIENNTKTNNALALAFAELSAALKTSVKIAIFIIPIFSTLIAYIVNSLVK